MGYRAVREDDVLPFGPLGIHFDQIASITPS